MGSSEKIVGWTDGPDTRGTQDIILNCLFTIIACTWSVLHLNLPSPQDSALRKLLRKLKWTSVTIIFPEFILAHASSERQVAIDVMDALRSKQASEIVTARQDTISCGLWDVESEICWRQRLLHPIQTMRMLWQGKLANSEQVQEVVQSQKESAVVKSVSLDTTSDPEKTPTRGVPAHRQKTWTVVHSYFANMGGIRVRTKDDGHSGPSQTYILTGKHLTQIDFDPAYCPLRNLDIEREAIEDQTDSDAFTKAIAIVQIGWLLFNLIARRVKQIPTTQLEIVTVAFGILAIFIYIAYWNKPQNVEYPCTIFLEKFSDNRERDLEIREALQPTRSMSFFGKVLWHLDYLQEKPTTGGRITNDNYEFNLLPHCLVSLVLVTAFFGGIHCTAWNFRFPTNVELQMWRTACVMSTTIPALIFASQWLATWYIKRKRASTCIVNDLELHPVHSFAITVGYIAYVLARLAIMAIALSSLRAMPVGVYSITWVKNIPSVQ